MDEVMKTGDEPEVVAEPVVEAPAEEVVAEAPAEEVKPE